MYLPSQLPSTRIAQSTSLLPATPAPPPAPATTPRHKTRYRPPLAGLTEEGEHLLRISSSRSHLWALLAATELSLYSNKLVLFKLTTTPLQLRTYGPNASLAWQDESRFVLSTHKHHFHYSIKSNKNPVYALPTKTAHDWPLGPGEAQSLTAIELNCQAHFEAKGNNVVTTQQYLLVPSDEPPSLLVMPFPVASDSKLPAFLPPFSADSRVLGRGKEKEVLPKWEGLGRGMMESGCPVRVGLDEWDWLVRGTPEEEAEEPTTIARILPLPGTLQEPMQRQEFVILASDGRGYLVHWGPSSPGVVPIPQKREGKEVLFDEDLETGAQEREDRERWEWKGICFHPPPTATVEGGELEEGVQAIEVVFNDAFGLLTLGCRDGTVSLYNYPSLVDPSGQVNSELGIHRPTLSHVMSLRSSLNTTVSGMQSGQVNNLSWTSDGYCLSIAWTHGYAIYSVYGRLGSWSVAPLSAIEGSASKVRSGGFGEEEGYGVQGERGVGFEDNYLNGVKSAFWSEGNLELFVLCPPPAHPKGKAYDEQIFVIPFIKSAVAGLHSPDNTKHAFLQMDDRVLVYRGADQPDMSVINPESDVWQHIKIPSTFIALHHPIRYAVISSDARLIAVAGRKGLTHYNALSGRWKLFENEREEASLVVCGGMAWWGNSLVVGCEEAGNYSIKVFSRDLPLTLANVLESVPLVSKPHLIAIFDSSLLVYTVDNTFHHYLIREGRDRAGVVRVGLRLGGSIGFEGVVGEPTRVRGMSWLVPKSQQLLGDPADDLNVATIIFLLRGQLILLRPRRVAPQEVKYDLQILCSHVEFYWTHLSGIGTLENSLWAWDGTMIRIWLERLTIEKVKVDKRRDRYESVLESVGIPLNFYPLAVLMDKGIIIGVDEETSLRRSLDFALFRIITTTHLFIPHILRYHLSQPVSELNDALAFASHYTSLVYFAHALEILLYVVLEEEVDGHAPSFALEEGEELASSVLRRTVDFLDHFDQSLKVVVGCARKTELKQWATLFGVAGKPRDLFEKCVMFGYLKEAASYLIVLHTMEPVEQSSKDTVRLLQAAQHARDWTLCRELLNFLYSLDRKGVILRAALTESSTLPSHLSPGDSASPAPSSDTATTPRISTDLEADDEETPSSAEQAHPSPSSDPPRLGSLLGRVGLPPGALVLPSRSFSAEQKK